MRYLTATLYGLAAASGHAGLQNIALVGGCVAVGTVLGIFAVEAIVQHEIKKAFQQERNGKRMF